MNIKQRAKIGLRISEIAQKIPTLSDSIERDLSRIEAGRGEDESFKVKVGAVLDYIESSTQKQSHATVFFCGTTWDDLMSNVDGWLAEHRIKSPRISTCHFHDGESMRYTAVIMYKIKPARR